MASLLEGTAALAREGRGSAAAQNVCVPLVVNLAHVGGWNVALAVDRQ